MGDRRLCVALKAVVALGGRLESLSNDLEDLAGQVSAKDGLSLVFWAYSSLRIAVLPLYWYVTVVDETKNIFDTWSHPSIIYVTFAHQAGLLP